jgi:hypothetical protein
MQDGKDFKVVFAANIFRPSSMLLVQNVRRTLAAVYERVDRPRDPRAQTSSRWTNCCRRDGLRHADWTSVDAAQLLRNPALNG